MPQVINGRVVYQGGERLPQVGSDEYQQAQVGVLPPTPQPEPTGPTSGSQTAINTQALVSEKPLVVPDAPPTTTAASIAGASGAQKESLQKSVLQQQQEQELSKKQKLLELEKEAFKDTYNEMIGVKSSRTQLEDDLGIKQKTDRYTASLNRLDEIDKSEAAELKALETANMTDAGRATAARDISRKYASQRADENFAFSVAQRDLDSAQRWIDRKIELQLEPLKAKLEFTKLFYDENRNALTKTEDRLFQAKIKDDERKYNETKALEDQRKSLLLSAASQGAPSSVIQGIRDADTFDGMVSAAGLFSGDILEREIKRKQLAKLNKEIAETGVPVVTNPDVGKYSQALGVILGSGKFTKDQKADVIRAVNSGEDPFAVVKNQAKNIMGQTLATKLDNYETAKSQLETIDSLLTQYYQSGGKTNIFKGNYEKAINRLGTVTDPKLVSIATNIQAALQIYRNAVSGTAYSVQEGKDIASIFPGINKSEGLNKAILNGRMKAFETTIDASYRNTLGSAYDALKKAKAPEEPIQSPSSFIVPTANGTLDLSTFEK